MGKIRPIILKIKLILFTTTLSISQILSQNCKKLTKNHTKTLVFTIRYITIKKIDDCENIYSVNPLYFFVNHASGHIEEKGMNKYLMFDWWK